MDETTSTKRDRRRAGNGGTSEDTPKWVAGIIIGFVVILALQVGGLRGFVQH